MPSKAEVLDVLGQGQLGDGDLVLDRARLLLGDLGLQQVADDALRLVLTLHRGGDDLVEGGLHPVELQLDHGGQDLGTLHHTAAPQAVVAGAIGNGLVPQPQRLGRHDRDRAMAGSRRRARMLMITSAEWTLSRSASSAGRLDRRQPVAQHGGQDRDHLAVAVIDFRRACVGPGRGRPARPSP